ncbi:MAG: hypothetical protein N2747_09065 [Chitinophagaceae bacterium]|nr:hypothetical protein [Chitinophagaceae bacterium]
MSNFRQHPSSFRDEAGFVFLKDDILYRQVNQLYAPHYQRAVTSGFYQFAIENNLLIPHLELQENLTGTDNWYTTLKPEPVQTISYPYEWPFDMLKDAALLTLRLTKEALRYGLILKDATPYNIQWFKGQLIFIDTLSFENYQPERPWNAYRQFCEQFLSPLLLMHYHQTFLHPLMLAWPEGIPIELTKKLLPFRSRFSLHTWLHIFLQSHISEKTRHKEFHKVAFSQKKLMRLLLSLELLIEKLKIRDSEKHWSAYYHEAKERGDYLKTKTAVLESWISKIQNIHTATDLGCNTGEFSLRCARKGLHTLAIDADAACINLLYRKIKNESITSVQPLIGNAAFPSPGIGWQNKERLPLLTRIISDVTLALALIHHLAISANIRFRQMAELFRKICKRFLIIEFVPADDEKTLWLLRHGKPLPEDYSEQHFLTAFQKHFKLEDSLPVADSGRTLYLFSVTP